MLKYSEGMPAFSARVTAKAVLRFTKSLTICELGMRPEATASSSAWKLLPLPLAMTTMRHGEAMVMMGGPCGEEHWAGTRIPR